ncbi:MAG: hypothetical protein JW838_08860 [Spirochaetes bacterium]|nr:hypothetical protein [Spirochaetota bacterium]
MNRELRIGECVEAGWKGFTANAGNSIGILMVFLVLSAAGGMIPMVNFVFNIIVSPILSAGLAIFALKTARGDGGTVEDLFKGFNQFGSFLGAYWLYASIVIAAMVPAGIGFLAELAIHGWSFSFFPVVTISVGAACVVCLVIVMLRLSMVYYLIFDGMEVIAAFRESFEMTRGHTGALFLLSLLLGLVMLLGILLLLVGTLATYPVCIIAFAAAYERLKRPGGTHGILPDASRSASGEPA